MLGIKTYMLGHDATDSEHLTLISLANSEKLIGPNTSIYDVLYAFCELYDYVYTHFEHEEKLIANWEGYENHKKLHKKLIYELDNLFAAHSELELLEDNGYRLFAEKLNTFIMSWLYDHILKCDAKFISYLNNT